ncbi:hypothetical protein D3C86_1840650 [compost metagenome]
MARRRQRKRRVGQAHGAFHGVLHRRLEIEVARLVVGRVGVGDVRRQHFLALRAQSQGLLVELEIFVKPVEHRGAFVRCNSDETRDAGHTVIPLDDGMIGARGGTQSAK